MNRRRASILATVVAFLAVPPHTLNAQTPAGTAFTYQGQLKSGGVPVNDTCEFEFGLWDDPSAGSLIGTNGVSGVAVADGLFTVQLDFGPTAFNGAARWLEIAVKGSGDPGFTTLSPRQPIKPTPHALYARGTIAVLNVRDYGAIGDGNSHPLSERFSTLEEAQAVYPHATSLDDEIDWAATQAAIDAVGPNGGTVYLPAGTYLLSAQLVMDTPKVLLKGDGGCHSSAYPYSQVAPTSLVVDHTDDAGIYISSHGSAIEGLMLTGPDEPAEGQVGIKIDGEVHPYCIIRNTLKDVTVRLFGGHGICALETELLVIEECVVNNNGRSASGGDGIRVDGVVTHGMNARIVSTRVYTNGGYQVHIRNMRETSLEHVQTGNAVRDYAHIMINSCLGIRITNPDTEAGVPADGIAIVKSKQVHIDGGYGGELRNCIVMWGNPPTLMTENVKIENYRCLSYPEHTITYGVNIGPGVSDVTLTNNFLDAVIPVENAAAASTVEWDNGNLGIGSGLTIGNGVRITGHLSGITSWDPPPVNSNGGTTSTTVNVGGANLGDTVAVGFSQGVPAGALLTGSVTSANTVTVTLLNMTVAPLDLGSGTLRADVWQHLCGDGVEDTGEGCDDGNTDAGDGCSSTCECQNYCGNGVPEAPCEYCDDGHNSNCGPCNADCTTNGTGTLGTCGDGDVCPENGEQCDDGNTDGNDGCDGSCIIEFCGDGIVQDAIGEQCEPPSTATCDDDCHDIPPP